MIGNFFHGEEEEKHFPPPSREDLPKEPLRKPIDFSKYEQVPEDARRHKEEEGE